MRRADICHAALLEAGRPDLADLVCYMQDDDETWYLEPLDEVRGDDFALMQRADFLAQLSVGP